MVGAEHVDAIVRAACALVEIVGEIARKIGCFAVGFDDHPVLVVAEVGRAKPQGAFFFIDDAALAQTLDRLGDRTRFVERILVEEDVEIGAEIVERRLDFCEHQLDASRTESLVGLLVGELARIQFAVGN